MPDTQPCTSRRADGCVLLLALLFPLLITWLYFVLLADWPTAIQQSAYGVGKCLQFGLPIYWVFLVQRQRFRLSRPTARGIPVNVAFGLAVVVATLLLYHCWLKPVGYLGPDSAAAGAIYAKVEGLGLDSPWKYAAFAAFCSIIHSGLEEYYWRWFVFGRLRRLLPLGAAIVVSSLGFMLHHVLLLGTYFDWDPLATGLFSLCVAAGGGVWAWFYHRSGSLLGPWLGHLLVDIGIFLVGYDLVASLF